MNFTGCPTYFIQIETPPYCAFECPLPIYTKKEYDAIFYLEIVASIVCILLVFFVLPVYLFSNKLRKVSNTLLIAIFITVFLSVLRPLFTLCMYSTDWQKLTCSNDYTSNDQSDPKCLFSGIWDYYFNWVAVLLWLCICLSILQKLFLKGIFTSKYFYIIYITFAILVPIVGVIVAVRGDAFVGVPALNSCYVKSGKYSHGLNLIPLAIVAILGLSSLFILIGKLVQTEGFLAVKTLLTQQIRLLSYIFVFIIPVTYSLIFGLHTYLHEEQIKDSVTKWAFCLFTINDPDICHQRAQSTRLWCYLLPNVKQSTC